MVPDRAPCDCEVASSGAGGTTALTHPLPMNSLARMVVAGASLVGVFSGCTYESDGGATPEVSVRIEDCVDGSTRPCGTNVGDCERGSETCEKGQWMGCSGIEPEAEACDGRDNDCDGDVDEGCECPGASARTCGINLGRCTRGRQLCVDGFWYYCDGVGPESETCNGEDDDCDGDVDDGFPVGEACERPGGCVGVRVCTDDHESTECVIDETAITDESCDGLDNNCDGIVDFTIGPTRAVSACECVERELSFGAAPEDESIMDGVGLCALEPGGSRMTTLCNGSDGKLAMSFCLTCASMPYAMCQSETAMDLGPFVLPTEGRALTVDFTFESSTAAKTKVNLYYTVDFRVGNEVKQLRRYFQLLAVGDQPGSYKSTFFPEHTCFARDSSVNADCQGVNTNCPACRDLDSCGTATGTDCDAMSFASARLQLAADWSACEGEFRGTVTIDEISYGPLSCDRE
jgi:hypothetical protein